MMAMAQAGPASAWSYLKVARKHHSQAAIAKHLEVDARTIRRWELRQTHPPAYVVHALQSLLPLQLPIQESGAFDYIDLFAGIGGIRIPFDEIGGRCVFTSEWDPYAQKTYGENFRHVGGIARGPERNCAVRVGACTAQ